MNIWIHGFSRAAGVELQPGLEVVPARPRRDQRSSAATPRRSMISRCAALLRRALDPQPPQHIDGACHHAR